MKHGEVDTKIKRTEMLKGWNTLAGILIRLVLQKLTYILLHTFLTFLPGSKVHSSAIKILRGAGTGFLYYICATISLLVFKVWARNNDLRIACCLLNNSFSATAPVVWKKEHHRDWLRAMHSTYGMTGSQHSKVSVLWSSPVCHEDFMEALQSPFSYHFYHEFLIYFFSPLHCFSSRTFIHEQSECKLLPF